MSTELCPCADLDWSTVDMSAIHHPDCVIAKGAASKNTGTFSVSLTKIRVRTPDIGNPATANSWGAGGFFEPGASRPRSLVSIDCKVISLGAEGFKLDNGVEVDLTPVLDWFGDVRALSGVERFGDYYILSRTDGQCVLYNAKFHLFSAPFHQRPASESLALLSAGCSCGYHANQSACDEVSRAVEMLAALPEPRDLRREIASAIYDQMARNVPAFVVSDDPRLDARIRWADALAERIMGLVTARAE